VAVFVAFLFGAITVASGMVAADVMRVDQVKQIIALLGGEAEAPQFALERVGVEGERGGTSAVRRYCRIVGRERPAAQLAEEPLASP
jgi:hypothetical protein